MTTSLPEFASPAFMFCKELTVNGPWQQKTAGFGRRVKFALMHACRGTRYKSATLPK
jgi:hypothetical protein